METPQAIPPIRVRLAQVQRNGYPAVIDELQRVIFEYPSDLPNLSRERCWLELQDEETRDTLRGA